MELIVCPNLQEWWKLLTLSSYSNSDKVNFSEEQAITKAEEFAKNQGINDVMCLGDVVENDAYINLAPVKMILFIILI